MTFVLYTPIYIEYAHPCVGMKTKICLMFNDAVFSVWQNINMVMSVMMLLRGKPIPVTF